MRTLATMVIAAVLGHQYLSAPRRARCGPLTPEQPGVTYNYMVVDLQDRRDVRSDDVADLLFHALADATRRDIVHHTGGGEYSVSQLASRYPMSFAAVQKHVAVLERAGLVTKERRGREQIVRSDAAGLQQARELLDGLEELWRGRIDRMKTLLDPTTDPDT